MLARVMIYLLSIHLGPGTVLTSRSTQMIKTLFLLLEGLKGLPLEAKVGRCRELTFPPSTLLP